MDFHRSNTIPTGPDLNPGDLYHVPVVGSTTRVNEYKIDENGVPRFVEGISLDQSNRIEQLTQSQITKLAGLKTQAEIDQSIADVDSKSTSEYFRLADGVTELPNPVVQGGVTLTNAWTWLKGGVTYTIQGGGTPIVASEGELNRADYNGTTWVLKDMGELPSTTIVDTVGTSTTSGASQRLVTTNINDTTNIKNQIGINERLVNGNFDNGTNNWSKNETPVLISVVDGVLFFNTNGGTDPAIVQSITAMQSGVYNIEVRVRKTSVPSIILRAGVTSNATFQFTLTGSDWQVFKGSINVTATGNKTFILSVPPSSQVEVDYIKCYTTSANSISSDLNALNTRLLNIEPVAEDVGVNNKIRNYNFDNGLVDWSKNENIFDMDIQDGHLHVTTTSNPNVGILQSSVPATVGTWVCEIKMKKISAGIFQFTLGTYTPGQKRTSAITVSSSDWQVYRGEIELLSGNISGGGTVGFMIALTSNVEVLIEYVKFYQKVSGSIDQRLSYVESNSENLSWFPPSVKSISPIKNHLQPFIDKYNARSSDVTIVETGDSISTDLNWTNKRPDANERPPFCTEYNINSYLEDKLRWKEQRYRRYDYEGVFVENLGGGSSSIVQSDTANWGFTGASYYLPLTKVIDGGTNSGVTFNMPTGIKRLSLIVHTDKAWATSTQVTISGGNGLVEVYNGSSWTEANGYSTSFKEADTSVSLGYNTDNAQKRLKFRSLTNTSEKTITVQNVGAGRFGYWGIEYSPYPYMFTYICASKGSHDITMLNRYESWMVDSFSPDLILWQCPVLNMRFGGRGGSGRSQASTAYGAQFVSKYNAYVSKGYLTVPFLLWGSTDSNLVDTSGNFLHYITSGGNFVSCGADADNMALKFEENDTPFVNLFHRITEVSKYKSQVENSNIYVSSLVGSGKDGKTFTVDGIHMNKRGNDVCFNMLEHYFNF